MEKLYVHMVSFVEEPYASYLHGLLDKNVVFSTGDSHSIAPETHFLVAGRPSVEQLEGSLHLHGLIIPFAGLPESTRHLLKNYPQIKVYNLHHNAASTAEMAITLMMAAVKRIVPADRIFRTHDWTPRHAPMPSYMLYKQQILIVGYGQIGRRIGTVCEAMGMQVVGIKRRPPFEGNSYPSSDLHRLLPTTRVLMICAPLTDETKGMIGEKEIALLPPEAVIINVGRAAIVDEKALYEALRDGRIHGAGFDVWYQYPASEAERPHSPPSYYPFHELENMVMSPHRAGGVGTGEIEYARMEALTEIINAAARGETIPNVVDLTLGY